LAYELDENSLVLDLGGFKGEWAGAIRRKFRCKVIVFEPVKEFADFITERFRGDEKVEICVLALGGENREDVIHLSGDGSSTMGVSGPSEVIQVRNVEEWLAERGAPAIDLVKINIEGGEYELLEKIVESGCQSKIRYLQIQFHPVGEDFPARIQHIRGELSKTHNMDWCYEMVWESWSRRP
jgi:FkbM family methyltransferase